MASKTEKTLSFDAKKLSIILSQLAPVANPCTFVLKPKSGHFNCGYGAFGDEHVQKDIDQTTIHAVD